MKLLIMPFGNVVPSCGFAVDQVIPSSVRTPEQLVPHVKHVSHTNGYYNLKANNFTGVRVRYFCTNYYEKTNGEQTCSCAVTFARANVHSDWTVLQTHDHSLVCANKRLELFKTDVTRAISKGTLTLDSAVEFTQPIPSKIIDILVPLIPSSKTKTGVKKRSPLSAKNTSHASANVSLTGTAPVASYANSATDVSVNHASTSKLPQPRIVINLRGKHVASTSSSTSVSVLQPIILNAQANDSHIPRSASSRKRRCAEVNYNENVEDESTKRVKVSAVNATFEPTSLAEVTSLIREIPSPALTATLDSVARKTSQRPRRAFAVTADTVTLTAGQKRAASAEDIEEAVVQPVKRARKSLDVAIDSIQGTKAVHTRQGRKSHGKALDRKPKHIRGKLSSQDIRYGLAGHRVATVPFSNVTHDAVDASDSDLDDICDSGRFDYVSTEETAAKSTSYATVQTLLDISAAPSASQAAHTAFSAAREVLVDSELMDIYFPFDSDEVECIFSDDNSVEHDAFDSFMAVLLTVAEQEVQQNEQEWNPMSALLAAVDGAEPELNVDML